MTNSMAYKGYTASMVFDAEDKIIVGRVLDIDDIISFHGESVAQFERQGSPLIIANPLYCDDALESHIFQR